MHEFEWIDAAGSSCKARTDAKRIFEREGLVKAIQFLENVPGTNLKTLELMKKEYGLAS